MVLCRYDKAMQHIHRHGAAAGVASAKVEVNFGGADTALENVVVML